jgi:hypothetical protein
MPKTDSARARRKTSGGDRAAGAPLTPAVLVTALDEAFRGPAWHGPSLVDTLRDCTADAASHRLAPGRNTIWELVLHAAYGKHLVRSRLTNERQRFARVLDRPWWPAAPEGGTSSTWKEDLALLHASHAALVESVAAASPARLGHRRARRRHTIGEEILGLALHDTYHGGQIVLIRRLLEGAPR